jgi:hypothetical protein
MQDIDDIIFFESSRKNVLLPFTCMILSRYSANLSSCFFGNNNSLFRIQWGFQNLR